MIEASFPLGSTIRIIHRALPDTGSGVADVSSVSTGSVVAKMRRARGGKPDPAATPFTFTSQFEATDGTSAPRWIFTLAPGAQTGLTGGSYIFSAAYPLSGGDVFTPDSTVVKITETAL